MFEITLSNLSKIILYNSYIFYKISIQIFPGKFFASSFFFDDLNNDLNCFIIILCTRKLSLFKVLVHFRRLKIRQFWIIFFSVPLIYIYMKLFLSCKYMFVEYKQIFILNFCFMAQIQGAPKSNIKKKIWRMADSLSLDRQVWNKKMKWFL